jgi:hypothetical protein
MKKKVGSDGKADSAHYGGADNPHETIKCLHAWGLEKDALCWTTGKYLSRAGKKEGATLLRDLEKAHFYLSKKIERLKAEMETNLKARVDDLARRSSASRKKKADQELRAINRMVSQDILRRTRRAKAR